MLTAELDVWAGEALEVPDAAKIHSPQCLHQNVQRHLQNDKIASGENTL